MAITTFGTRTQSSVSKTCRGVLHPYLAVPSTRMGAFTRMLSAMTGARAMPTTTLPQQRTISFFMPLQMERSRPGHDPPHGDRNGRFTARVLACSMWHSSICELILIPTSFQHAALPHAYAGIIETHLISQDKLTGLSWPEPDLNGILHICPFSPHHVSGCQCQMRIQCAGIPYCILHTSVLISQAGWMDAVKFLPLSVYESNFVLCFERTHTLHGL